MIAGMIGSRVGLFTMQQHGFTKACRKALLAVQLLERLKLWPEQQNNMRSQDSLCTPSANPAPKQSMCVTCTKLPVPDVA